MFTACEGEEGPQGIGLNSLTNISTEQSGDNCENGGIKFEVGLDSNENGILDETEVSATQYICNGINGSNSLTKITNEPAGTNCENGGLKIDSGLDTNANGTLDETEISATAYICNGINGNNSLTKITSEPAGINCTSGGLKVDSGIDINNNGILDEVEVSTTAYICNGLDGSNSLTKISNEPVGSNCENGGLKIESGLDTNANGILDEAEINATNFICNGNNGNNSITRITDEPAGTNCENGGIKIEFGIDLNNNNILDSEEITSTTFDCNTNPTESYQILYSFGSEGTQDGEFLSNEHISIDSSDNIYVVDTNGGKIERFNNDGTFLNRFQTINSPRNIHFFNDGRFILTKSAENIISVSDQNGAILNEWGSSGNGNSQFGFFRQIAVDTDEFIYVVDHNNHRIQKFDTQGNFITKWGQNGSGDGDFDFPWGIAVLGENIITSDNNGIQIFNKSGDFIKKVMIPNVNIYYDIATKDENIFIACGNVVVKTTIDFDNILYIGDGDFSGVTGIAVDSNDNIIVSDLGQRIVTVLGKN
ncbi:hypothetical protein GCM10009430_46260 [Aquimarina litoralis]|uniref:DUF7151 domain-containing protein n=2 Tax=Aquimarina litoralis TaxID=584605 RepID=A0ABP3UJF1_9FLAO